MEEGMDRGQADITGGGFVVACILQVIEKIDDIFGKDITEIEPSGFDRFGRGQETQQQNERIAITAEGVRAQAP